MEPLRDDRTKLCIRCTAGERGLLLGMIEQSMLNAFDGYVNNPSGTKRKIVEGIYKKGDRAFNTGKRTAKNEKINLTVFSTRRCDDCR